MKLFKRILCLSLSLIFVAQMMIGCSSKKTDEEIYLTKGEFFAYFVYENNMTSQKYSTQEIQNCEDGSVEADIIVEWGYLPEKLAKKNLNKPVEKEIVVMVCANATFGLKKGNSADIKDADLLNAPQLIADAYASGFFELENGYFDGAQHMSFADCEEIMNKAKNYTANFHYEANTETTSTAEGVKEQDISNYEDGDIFVEFFGDEVVLENSMVVSSEEKLFETSNDSSKFAFLSAGTSPQITTLESKVQDSETTLLAKTPSRLSVKDVTGFSATFTKSAFEESLGNPQIGDTVVIKKFKEISNDYYVGDDGEIIGVLISMEVNGSNYICKFKYPDFEEAVSSKNIETANASKIDTEKYEIFETKVGGWELSFNVTSSSVGVTASKGYTTYETGRKQDWQNSKQTVNAKAEFEISNFNVDINNLKSFVDENNGEGFIKVTCDTTMAFSLSQSLRYTPDSNRNGKFPSNWSNSRWTDTDSKGAKEIKIAKIPIDVYGVASVNVYIYLEISVDGKIEFSTSIDGGGVQITANNGNVSVQKLGEKKSEATAEVNLHGRFGIDVSVTLFKFINVIEYDIGLDLDIHAAVSLYYENKLEADGVYADQEGLEEYAADDSKFNYCIGVQVTVSISGELKDSGVKKLLKLFSAGDSLNFSHELWTGGIHIEDGAFVDKCTRGDEVEESDSDEVVLSSYKVILEEGESDFISLKAVPSETVNLLDSKNSITVESNNPGICTVTYDKTNNLIIVEAVGEGSTEIVIKAKKGIVWWKDNCEQKISVTVNPSSYGGEFEGISYIITNPYNTLNFKYM